MSTPASEKCGLDPTELNYVITLTADSMLLKYGDLNTLYANDEQVDKTIFDWNYAFIRRYGIVNGFFSFEAGRKCTSGEGKNLDLKYIYPYYYSPESYMAYLTQPHLLLLQDCSASMLQMSGEFSSAWRVS